MFPLAPPFGFSIHAQSGKARVGEFKTARGIIRTPAFMPVGTSGTVKAMLPEHVRATGSDIILGNTYHLMLRPGAKQVRALGGLHTFMNWPQPILTDSGGFQIMSLAQLCTIQEHGVEFQSHIDGTKHVLTPEDSIRIQTLLGSDIVMCFDECIPYPISFAKAQQSMHMSLRWAKRSHKAFTQIQPKNTFLFGIQQGSMFETLRKHSAEGLIDMGFDGYAIGGLAVGEERAIMEHVLNTAADMLPVEKPRYLMGVGKPHDIVNAVLQGVDMFDCVLPSRSGRNGQAFTHRGVVNIKNARHKDDPRPLDDVCSCPACRGYCRAYLHHVFKNKEIIAAMLLTWHNVHYYQTLMANLRKAIHSSTLSAFKAEFDAHMDNGDIPPL